MNKFNRSSKAMLHKYLKRLNVKWEIHHLHSFTATFNESKHLVEVMTESQLSSCLLSLLKRINYIKLKMKIKLDIKLPRPKMSFGN